MDLRSIAKALGGEVTGGQVLCPGPGHSPCDRSLSVKLANNEDGFIVFSHANDDWVKCKDHVRAHLNGGVAVRRGVTSARPAMQSAVEKVYDYTDENGNTLFQVQRLK